MKYLIFILICFFLSTVLFAKQKDNFFIDPMNPYYFEIRNNRDSLLNLNSVVVNDSSLYDIYFLTDVFLSEPSFEIVSNQLGTQRYYSRGVEDIFFDFGINDVNLNDFTMGLYQYDQINKSIFDKIILSKSPLEYLENNGSKNDIILTESIGKRKTSVIINFDGGNNFGSAGYSLYTKLDNFFFISSGTYNISSGYVIPNNIPENIREKSSSILNNSARSIRNIRLKTGLNDNRSQLTAEFIHQDNSREYPYGIYYNQNTFYNQNTWKSNLFIFRAATELTYDFNIDINLYYKQFKIENQFYDDSTFDEQELFNSYPFVLDNYAFGADLNFRYNPNYKRNSLFSIGYERQIIRAYDPSYKRNEIEILKLKAAHSERLSKDFKIIGNTAYETIIPVISESNLEDYIPQDYGLFSGSISLSYWLIRNIEWVNSITYKQQAPQLNEFMPISDTISLRNDLMSENLFIYESSLYFSPVGRFHFGATFFINSLDNFITLKDNDANLYTPINNSNKINSGIESKLKFLFQNLKLEGGGIYYFTRYDFLAQYKLMTKVRFLTPFGTNVMIESIYTGERKDFVGKNDLEPYLLLNLKLEQNFYNNSTISLELRNILDQYYEFAYGIPQPGFFFIAAVNFRLL